MNLWMWELIMFYYFFPLRIVVLGCIYINLKWQVILIYIWILSMILHLTDHAFHYKHY